MVIRHNRLMLLFFMFLFLVAWGRPHVVTAANESRLILEVSPSAKQTTPTPTPMKFTEYVMAFPGMMLDNPLYIFKRMRDYLLEVFIADPFKKVEFYVLQSDKYIQMTSTFALSGKLYLAQTALSDAQKYSEKAMRIIVKRKEETLSAPQYILATMEDSLFKHVEVMDAMGEYSASQDVIIAKETISDWLSTLQKYQN